MKPRICAAPDCGSSFIPLRMGQNVCGPRCAMRLVKATKAQGKRALRERKAALVTVKELKAKAQCWFNRFIRLRDAELPCVSCGAKNPPMKPGGQWDAGHFLSRGAYPELAFNEDNCHKQCKSCNGGSGKYGHKERTVSAKYEEELLRRIGPERLAALKGPHEVVPLDPDALIELAETYKAKCKELERNEA